MQSGQKQLTHFFENVGGLNLTDSPFAIKPSQATGGYNYEYVKTGGFQKSLCPTRINSVADAQLRTLGLFLRNTKASAKSIIRAAGTKIQLTELTGTFTNLSSDAAAAGTDFLTAGSEQPVVGVMTTSPSVDILWLAGGGMTGIKGVPSDTQVTQNGVATPTGAISATDSGGGGDWATTGTYFYSVVYRKRSTQALSNAGLDISHVVGSTSNRVSISFSGLTNLDATLYDAIYLYRSAVGGVTGFTAGDLVAIVDSDEASYLDDGSSISESEVIPRAGNTILDNSVLPSGTYKTLALFKRRLVTASGSTVYLSDLNKFESFPAGNTIEVPSGGEITGLAIISFTTPSSTSTDEFLAVFKENELWVITGDDVDTWALKFVDSTGCLGQPLIVSANGYLYFIDNRGIYLWDGAGKPVYISRPIEDLFGATGKIDRSKLDVGFGCFFKRQNQVVWCLSNTDIGEQRYLLKLDLRLTLPSVSNTLGQRILDGVFLPGKVANPAYAGASFVFPTSSNQEDVYISGDDAGYVYRQFYSTVGVGADDYDFTYDTNYLDMGLPVVTKSFQKVIVWVENVGNWDLILDYWADYRASLEEKSTVPVTINSNTDGTVSLWDVAKWDEASWDSYMSQPKALVFNLNAQQGNNNVGEVLKLRFRNQNSDEPITVFGFTVVWTESGLRK
jgi:hypothetical protein